MKSIRLSSFLVILTVITAVLLTSYSFVKASSREKVYKWAFNGKTQELRVKLPESTYQHYRSKKRTYKYGSFALEDAGHEIIPPLARGLASKAKALKLSHYQRAEYITAFVQSLKYFKDAGEYPRYPVETLIDGGGDCEDTAVLLAAILNDLGYDCILLSPPGHMAVGLSIKGFSARHYLYEGRKYYYIETTGSNWDIGQIPSSYIGTANVFELWGVEGNRNALVYEKPVKPKHSYRKGEPLAVSFSRSESGSNGTYTDRQAFQYRIEMTGDALLMKTIAKVQYRREHSTFPEYKTKSWITKTNLHQNFKSEWTAWGYAPVRVKIVFRNGTSQSFLVENAPVAGL